MKVAVVGVGHLGRHHARIYEEMEGVELTAVVDTRQDRVDEIALAHHAQALADYRELFGKVDAVSLAVPTVDHARIGVDLLDHGIDVLVEKPLAASLSDARLLVDA